MIRWSHSRDKDVRTCERRVFLKNRYASSRADRDSVRFHAYLLKKAIDAPAWAGKVIHEVIKTQIAPSLRQGRRPDFALAGEYTLDLLARQERFSRERKFLEATQTAAGVDFCILRPHVNGSENVVELASRAAELALGALHVLEYKHSALLDELRGPGDLVVEKEIRFMVGDVMVEAIPDVLFISRSGQMLILDWKLWLGNSSAAEQLHVYAYAVLKSGWWRAISIERLRLREANLITGAIVEAPITEEHMATVDERIFSGSEKLERVFGIDEINDVSLLEFAPASRPGACHTCPVLEICNGTVATEQQTKLSFEFIPA